MGFHNLKSGVRVAGTPPFGRIQSVSRALSLLSMVARGEVEPTGTALAKAAGLAVPTAHHLLGTLTAHGMLARDEHGGYLLGPAVAVLADAYHRDAAPPGYLLGPLRRLVASTGETGYLATWRRGEIALLAVVDGDLPVRVSVPGGHYRDAHARASGKLLLAMADDRQRAGYLAAHPPRPVTDRTVTSGRRLAEEFRTIRAQGYAIEQEEFQTGVGCVAAPVRHDGMVVASYALSVPAERFRVRHRELTTALLAAADSVFESTALGAAR
jgi:DNA-binding IclR family transcriptional regulator